jgi:hypothetical protein
VIRALYPRLTPAQAAGIIVPHQDQAASSALAAQDGAAPLAARPPAQPH